MISRGGLVLIWLLEIAGLLDKIEKKRGLKVSRNQGFKEKEFISSYCCS